MQIRYHCPTDRCVAIIEYEPIEECTGTIKCPRCHLQHPIATTESMRQDAIVDHCAVCGGTEMFVRKDFPQHVGVAVVVVFGLAAIYYFRTSIAIAWSILAGGLFLDLLIYLFIGRVTACYACRAEYRKCLLNPAHTGFDLATSEKY